MGLKYCFFSYCVEGLCDPFSEYHLSHMLLRMLIQHTSFSDGGKFNTVPLAVERAFELESGGADMIDIGGESSRPGSVAVTVEDEMERVIPVIK